MSEARVRVSLSDGVLEFEGSESFVTSQVEKFTKIIQAGFAGERPIADEADADGRGGATDAGGTGAGGHTQPAASAPPSPDVDLKDILEATDTGVQILKALPRLEQSGEGRERREVVPVRIAGAEAARHGALRGDPL